MSNGKLSDEDRKKFEELIGRPPDSVDPILKPIVTVKISGFTAGSFTLGGGKYVGKMVQNEVAPTATSWLTSDLDDTDLGFDEADDCYVLNYAEKGTSGHVLVADDMVNGNVIGTAPDGRYIVAVKDVTGIIPVLVYKDGGSGGSSSAYPSWTYTIKTFGGVTIATGVLVKGYPRFIKAAFTQATDGTIGYAVNNAGTWELGMVQEANTQTNC